MPPIVRLIFAYILITLVVLISDRSRTMAGILATAPVNIPIILWLVWSKQSDPGSMQITARSMLIGLVSTSCFVAVCWFGFSRRWSLLPTFALGYVAWALAVFGPSLIRRIMLRG